MLTEKQERFCRNIVAGMTNKDAYISAYNSKGSEQNAWNESGKLLVRADIQERIKILRYPLEEHAKTQALNARSEQIEYIKQRIAICEQKEDEQSIIRYTDMLNKINALYKESETEQKQESTVNTLDLDTLKKLSGAS